MSQPSSPRDLVVLGEALVSLVPENHSSVRRSERLRRFTGGAEVNVAVAASRLGHSVTWIGRVGDDLSGQGVLDDLRREGVFLDNVAIDSTAHTGMLVRENPKLGAPRVSYARAHSAGSRVAPGDIDEAVVAGHRMALVSGVTAALSPSALEAARDFLVIARHHCLTTVFDLNYRSRLWSKESASPVLAELARSADIVSGGAEEWRLAFGTDDLQAVPLAPEVSLIKTDSHHPVTARVAGHLISEPTRPTDAIDVIGAGDGFVGGVLSALLAQADWPTALKQGVYCGARVVSGLGDWSNLPWGVDGLADIPERDQEVLR